MKAIVTGAYGFVGRHLTRELLGAGYEVLAEDIVDVNSSHRSSALIDGLPEGVVYKKCDLMNAPAVDKLIKYWNPDAVFHLAAQSSGALSFKYPADTVKTNFIGFLNLVEAVRKNRKKARILAVGSCEEYGKRSRRDMPLSENTPIEPVNPYAASKAAQSVLALQYVRSFDMNLIVTRSFSHTGPGQSVTFVFPSFARQCARIKAGSAKPVIKTGNLDIFRDFLDVRDVVRAYRLIVEKGETGNVYNVCSGEGLNLGDALRMMVEEAGIKVNIETDPDLIRPVDVTVFTGNNKKMRDCTGWERRISVEQMISDLLEYWYSRSGD
ncbi:MAG TPA: GDP-mannose 4,6-dehydratase [Candidatus Krumholzibacteriaceae bacterium]|nr:GDP-mannose 4,6-dehydratase [Candidatus Krumholzibacteriaceae bacterium]